MKPADVAAGPLLVDTDVVSYFHAQRGPAGGPTLADLQALVDGHPLVISFATYGEMLAGGHRAGFGETRMNAIRTTLSRYVVLPATAKTSEIWAQLYAKVRGHLSHENGANDVWIAAVALVQDPPLPIVTNNLKDFQAIAQHATPPGLTLVHPSL